LIFWKERPYQFNGAHGEKIEEIDIPEDMKDQVEKYRNEMIERVAECDDALTEKYLNGDDISVEDLRAAIRKGVLCHQDLPGLGRHGLEEHRRAASA
jgi:elongation factor G